MNGLLMMLCVLCGWNPENVPIPVTTAPALQTIHVLKIVPSKKGGTEEVEVSFQPGKGSEEKAKRYAANFVWARGKTDKRGGEPACISVFQKGKMGDTYSVTVRYEDDLELYSMSAVTGVGPLVYEGDFLIIPITMDGSSTRMEAATGVKIWFMYAEVAFEEDWRKYHTLHPLEFSLGKGMERVEKEGTHSFAIRSPRHLPKKESAKVTSK